MAGETGREEVRFLRNDRHFFLQTKRFWTVVLMHFALNFTKIYCSFPFGLVLEFYLDFLY